MISPGKKPPPDLINISPWSIDMNLRISKPPYSYRDDNTLPDFDDSRPVIVMDGQCGLCAMTARRISYGDKAGEFGICRSQAELGTALLRHYGIDAQKPESWLYILDGRAYSALDGIIRAGARVGGTGWLFQPLRILPRSLQEGLYRWVARNRYRIFGRTDMCALRDEALRARLME